MIGVLELYFIVLVGQALFCTQISGLRFLSITTKVIQKPKNIRQVPTNQHKNFETPPICSGTLSRRQWMSSSSCAAGILCFSPYFAHADDALPLTNSELKTMITRDILENQFLATGNITRSIYRPTATFTDEIDTYSLDQWVKGTQRLFVGNKSSVRLVGDVSVSDDEITFCFDEDLMFNIPFRPVVSLSGKVVLSRDKAGFITAYQEFWDQDTLTVLKTAKFGR